MRPARRRDAVVRVCERFGLSERGACRAVGQQRSTHRHRPAARDADEPVRRRLRQISRTDPRFGYRRAWATVRSEGFTVNRKRVQRLWREEGLRVPPQRLKRRRVGAGTVPAERLVATRRNQVWGLDFLFDTGVALSSSAATTAPVRRRGDPRLVPVLGHRASFIEPGSPWQNPYVEGFNARARDELFSREVFDTVRGARVLHADWWHRYNHHHPHSSLGWMTPAAYAAAEMGRVPEPTP